MSAHTDNRAKVRAHAARLDLIANQEGELDVADAYDRLAEAEDASYIAHKTVGGPEDPCHHVWW